MRIIGCDLHARQQTLAIVGHRNSGKLAARIIPYEDLLYAEIHSGRRYAVRNHHQPTRTGFLIERNIEVSRNYAAEGDGHAAVVMRPAVENMSSP